MSAFRALLLLLGAACAATPVWADSVYRCVGKDGAIAFQDHACASGVAQRQIEVTSDPPIAAIIDVEKGSRPSASRGDGGGSRQRRVDPTSYECRTSSGLVFYRHSRCPATLPGSAKAKRSAVTSQPMPRGDACKRMRNRARDGEELDERASTYDRNLGRDTCRGY